MDSLFSCRNCIHNSLQSLHIGDGAGFCVRHHSVLENPSQLTCKYLHRKDLPHFVVDEGIREHAAEFAGLSGIADLHHKTPVKIMPYNERFAWDHRLFNPLINALAQSHKTQRVFIPSFSGGTDGQRALIYSSLIRRYLAGCDNWTDAYRLILALLVEIDITPHVAPRHLYRADGLSEADAAEQALWDVIFCKLAALQEYGWHAGLEALRWATDALDGGLSDLNWPILQAELATRREEWTDLIIRQAKAEEVFFPPQGMPVYVREMGVAD